MTDDQYYDKFKAALKKREAVLYPGIRSYYLLQYALAIKGYTHTKDPVDIAKSIVDTKKLKGLYKAIYGDIYVNMGDWSREHEKGSQKGLDTFLRELQASSVFESDVMYNNRGRFLKYAQRDSIVKILDLFRSDPAFISLNERDAQRTLMTYFKELSGWQARRLIRTEATYAANAGTMKAYKLLFPGRHLKKEWHSSNSNRTRPEHRTRKGVFVMSGLSNTIDQDEVFVVGGEALPFPGGGNKPSNNVNCRCVLIMKTR